MPARPGRTRERRQGRDSRQGGRHNLQLCPREVVAQASDGELFLYPGDRHYFADSSLPSYDADATALLVQRVLEFLRG
jgi:dienelactone hydrolase